MVFLVFIFHISKYILGVVREAMFTFPVQNNFKKWEGDTISKTKTIVLIIYLGGLIQIPNEPRNGQNSGYS